MATRAEETHHTMNEIANAVLDRLIRAGSGSGRRGIGSSPFRRTLVPRDVAHSRGAARPSRLLGLGHPLGDGGRLRYRHHRVYLMGS
jgi:hypothetical protein